MLITEPVSRASAVQRAGRAGRTRPGKCYRLCTLNTFQNTLVSIQAKERASRNGSTVVDISIKPYSFKLVSLPSPRSPLSKTPKHVIF